MKSALAEETVIARALREPALLDLSPQLKGEDFSVALLGGVYDQMQQRHREGLEVNLGVLAELEPEQMSHLTGICQRQEGPVNENAYRDCVAAITGMRQARQITSDDDLLAFRNKLKERKGTK